MKNLVATVLFTCICAGLVLAQNPKASSNDASVAEILKQQAQDFGDAIRDVDADKLKEILAEDWVSLGSSGRI
jgi:hypothetical protein